MRAIGVNRRPADNRLATAVPTARRKVDALGGTVLRTATDQRRAVKAARSGRLTEAVAPAPGAVRHAGAGRARERDRAGASGPPPTPRFPARTRCSTAASTPRNLTSGRRPRRLHQDSPCPKASGPEGRDPSVTRRLAARGLYGPPAGIGRGQPPRRWLELGGAERRIRSPSARRPPAPPRGPGSARARSGVGGRGRRSRPAGPSRAPGPRAPGTSGSARSRAGA
jgi:hypothetical protein